MLSGPKPGNANSGLLIEVAFGTMLRTDRCISSSFDQALDLLELWDEDWNKFKR